MQTEHYTIIVFQKKHNYRCALITNNITYRFFRFFYERPRLVLNTNILLQGIYMYIFNYQAARVAYLPLSQYIKVNKAGDIIICYII